MANTSVIVIPEGKICDYVDGKFRNDTPEEYVRQTIEKRLVNEHIFTFICYQTMVQNLSIAAHTVPSYHILMIHISTIYLCLCLKILRFNRKSIPLLLRLTKNVMRLIS